MSKTEWDDKYILDKEDTDNDAILKEVGIRKEQRIFDLDEADDE